MALDDAGIDSQAMESIKSLLPYFVRGIVVKGFGRGSKQLGCPTGSFQISPTRLYSGFRKHSPAAFIMDGQMCDPAMFTKWL